MFFILTYFLFYYSSFSIFVYTRLIITVPLELVLIFDIKINAVEFEVDSVSGNLRMASEVSASESKVIFSILQE